MSADGLHTVAKRKPGQPVRWYVYAWRGGPQIMTKVGGTKPTKLDSAAVAKLSAAQAERHRVPTDTISGLAAAWRASPEWQAYAPDTKKQWGHKLSAIEAKWGQIPLAVFDDRRARARIIAYRDSMADMPRKADYHMQVLRGLLAYGVMLNRLALNLADGIPTLYKNGSRANIIWEPIEREVMELGLSQPVSDAFRLACLTGFRRAELAGCPLDAVKADAIVWATQKSGRRAVVTVPMVEPLRDLISELRTRPRKPGVGSILVNSRGQAWTPDGLDSSFGDERDRIGFDKHLHDCRGTFVTELCLAELTDSQIAGIVGWSVANVANIRRIYVDQARTVVEIGAAIRRRLVNRAVNQ